MYRGGEIQSITLKQVSIEKRLCGIENNSVKKVDIQYDSK